MSESSGDQRGWRPFGRRKPRASPRSASRPRIPDGVRLAGGMVVASAAHRCRHRGRHLPHHPAAPDRHPALRRRAARGAAGAVRGLPASATAGRAARDHRGDARDPRARRRPPRARGHPDPARRQRPRRPRPRLVRRAQGLAAGLPVRVSETELNDFLAQVWSSDPAGQPGLRERRPLARLLRRPPRRRASSSPCSAAVHPHRRQAGIWALDRAPLPAARPRRRRRGRPSPAGRPSRTSSRCRCSWPPSTPSASGSARSCSGSRWPSRSPCSSSSARSSRSSVRS